MMISWIIIYIGILSLSLILSLILTPLSERMGMRLSLMDVPKPGKFHEKTRARSGGIAIFASFVLVLAIGLCLGFILYRQGGFLSADVARLVKNIPSVMPKLIGLLVGASFIFLVGLWDDKWNLNPWTKLLCQIVSAIPLLLAGIRIEMFLPAWMGCILTIFWIVLLTNSFNFLDNMDGLSSGIAAIVCLVLAFVTWHAQDLFVTAILVALAGSILGFWYFNFIKSRLFMGDGGSLFIGYMIASLTILATYYKKGIPTTLPVLTPFIILGVPLFDTVSVLYIRFRMGKSLMKGDTNHFSHRLVNIGMSPRQAVVFIYLVTICVALAAMPLAYLPLQPALIQAAQVALWFLLIFLIERAGKKKIEADKNGSK